MNSIVTTLAQLRRWQRPAYRRWMDNLGTMTVTFASPVAMAEAHLLDKLVPGRQADVLQDEVQQAPLLQAVIQTDR